MAKQGRKGLRAAGAGTMRRVFPSSRAARGRPGPPHAPPQGEAARDTRARHVFRPRRPRRSRKALPGKARAKIVSKYTTTSNVDREMKASVKHKGHQSLRRERPARKVDLEKRARE